VTAKKAEPLHSAHLMTGEHAVIGALPGVGFGSFPVAAMSSDRHFSVSCSSEYFDGKGIYVEGRDSSLP
jgi:hypothetical protein